MMFKTIAAIERDGLDLRVLGLVFRVPSEDFDLISAVKNATADYCKTKEGKEELEYNGYCFNWGDFVNSVPEKFCEKYGFYLKDMETYDDIVVDFHESLVGAGKEEY